MTTEVTLIQFMRPNGTPVEVRCPVTDEQAIRAEEMVLTCEVLMGGEVVIYGRMKDAADEDEYLQMAENEPGPQQPDIIVGEVINYVWEHRLDEREEAQA